MNCKLCGNYLVNHDGPGRPLSYHSDCKAVRKLINWLSLRLPGIDFSDDSREQLKGEFRALMVILDSSSIRRHHPSITGVFPVDRGLPL